MDIGEDISLWRSLRRESTTEVLNRELDISVIETNTRRRKNDRGRRGGEGLIMMAAYTQVENTLGIHLIYSYIRREFPM